MGVVKRGKLQGTVLPALAAGSSAVGGWGWAGQRAAVSAAAGASHAVETPQGWKKGRGQL